MTARILVVDDVPANVKFLEARLSAEYFLVTTAANGTDALRLCAGGAFDVVLLDVVMPGPDGFEVCRRLKADPATAHVPVILVTALDEPADRLRGLEAGADEFLTKPLDELSLLARVRSLARLKVVVDELLRRAESAASVALHPGGRLGLPANDDARGRILVIEDRPGAAERLAASLAERHDVTHEADPEQALAKAASGTLDLVMVSLGFAGADPLRVCSRLRSSDVTRDLPILLIADAEDRERIVRGLEIGINDYILRPVDRNELAARVRAQLRRKRYADRLRDIMRESLQLAIIDPLTGLHNRRYFESQVGAMLEAAAVGRKPLSLMILDLDHFKGINDGFGHDVGDEVLKGFAARLRGATRAFDLVCRLGGEEFIVVMPDTDLATAEKVAERVRRSIGDARFPIEAGARELRVTVSIGLAERRDGHAADALLKRADRALYHAKSTGRDRVSADAA